MLNKSEEKAAKSEIEFSRSYEDKDFFNCNVELHQSCDFVMKNFKSRQERLRRGERFSSRPRRSCLVQTSMDTLERGITMSEDRGSLLLSSFCCAKGCENWSRPTERSGQLCLFACDTQCLSACDTLCLSVCDVQCLSACDAQCSGMHSRAVMFLAVELSFASASGSRYSAQC